MSAIVYFSATKTVEISNIAQDEVVVKEETAIPVNSDSNELKFMVNKDHSEYLSIPLPENTESDAISIENHYMDKELYVSIDEIDYNYYKNISLEGKHDNIISGNYKEVGKGLSLIFKMDNVYECKTILENNHLYISFFNPKEVYERIIVIDPACGGNDNGVSALVASSSSTKASHNTLYEKDIVLDVAKKVKEKLDKDESIKVYYTRMDDVNPTLESRVALGNGIRADAYIRICVDEKNNASEYGITSKYNEEYFIPGFGNVQLSDIMEKSVVTAVKGKAIGLLEADKDDYVLKHLNIPATEVMIGCISNKQEAILLGREEYIEKIAQGIVDGITSIYIEKTGE